ncbi:EamA family transporter [Balneatrix alpica]|uniref:EamA family transporter n=1 Tax=Balneatrix alpica TaxID=75684 RepID=A0ABV5ZDC8_9GAMM|nr:EamA family transporter [Balneatrix alpica]
MTSFSTLYLTLSTALAPIIWGSTYIVTSELLPPDRPFIAAVIRVLPAGLLLVLASRYWPQRQQWRPLLILALLNIGLFQALLFISAYRLPGGLAAIVGALQPLLIMLLAWLFEQRIPRAYSLAAAALGVVGMALLLLSPQSSWDYLGVLAAFASAISMAAGTYLAQRWQLGIPLLTFTGWQLLLGGIMLAPLAWWWDPALPALSAVQGWSYAYLSLAGALLAYSLWFRGLSRLSPVAVSSLGLLSPLTAVMLGWYWLQQSLSGLALFGMFAVLSSVLLIQHFNRPGAIRPQPRSSSHSVITGA